MGNRTAVTGEGRAFDQFGLILTLRCSCPSESVERPTKHTTIELLAPDISTQLDSPALKGTPGIMVNSPREFIHRCRCLTCYCSPWRGWCRNRRFYL
ncbi:hypothetical protein CDAR_458161 [Caerostris darwini]|uniref:Uncharacterized protein n=2 Tax=Caerostris TaxID=172845 RepID=A0AAV4WUE5_9ARAC|nr:hypothetical protein CEXT_278331 [Caerostris extrusa]GIY86541.1 hypothetical protein CDAR_458161 [Caerostris darwini]